MSLLSKKWAIRLQNVIKRKEMQLIKNNIGIMTPLRTPCIYSQQSQILNIIPTNGSLIPMLINICHLSKIFLETALYLTILKQYFWGIIAFTKLWVMGLSS
jgi:hypothetical protein